MSVEPFAGKEFVAAVSVMVDPDGASNGTCSHAVKAKSEQTAARSQVERPAGRGIINSTNILICMDLAGQPKPAIGSSEEPPYIWQEHGYAMAVLLVALSMMSVMMT